jgi:predicted dehydrogenase
MTMTAPITLITLAPGHFHAALLQKTMCAGVAPTVYVYAPAGPDVAAHLQRLEQFNTRAEQPTHWQPIVYTGEDYLETMLQQSAGQLVVIAGVNSRKTSYVHAAVQAGLHVLVDKPMCITPQGWQQLTDAFAAAQQRGVCIYDIMTARHEITSLLCRELVNTPSVFGTLSAGTPDAPAVVKHSTHHLYKQVDGRPLTRPAWYFDVAQQGEGIVDVTTHLVDMVLWECFPDQAIDYTRDVTMVSARRWPTVLSRAEFTQVTGLSTFPPGFRPGLDAQGGLPYSCNGEILFRVKGVYAKVMVQWDFEAPAGGGDTHASVMRGSTSTVRIRQGAAPHYRPEVYVEPTIPGAMEDIGKALRQTVLGLQRRYPGVDMQWHAGEWQISIPEVYRIGHEAHFSQVFTKYVQYLQHGTMPAWEVPNMLTKYFITTQGLRLAEPH